MKYKRCSISDLSFNKAIVRAVTRAARIATGLLRNPIPAN